ncbi:PDZ domain-containing protein [uncultured Deinococcus sp.]|uniref:PDZ domain-containing protein n=1 Tax=uncultured Deinococcus sp. TaxID=158789 RepID=UPI0025F4F1C3|nr:PDZ domain-containing protein [uncultured Deinococcus sp.]
MTHVPGLLSSRRPASRAPRSRWTASVVLGALLCGPALAATVVAPTTGGPFQGVIVDWPQGQTGTLQLSSGDTGVLAEGTVDATGRFTIALPGLQALEPNLAYLNELFAAKSNYGSANFSCRGSGTATPTTAQFREYFLTAYSGSQQLAELKLNSGSKLPYPVGVTYGQLTYATVPITLDGTVTCTGTVYVFKGSLPAGWSLVPSVLNTIDAAGVSTYTQTLDDLPAAVRWHLYDELVGVGITIDPPVAGTPGFALPSVVAGGPAAQAGVRAGDVLVQIDGKDVTGLTVNQLIALIRGEADTAVTLGVRRGTSTEVVQIKVTRRLLKVP